MFVNLQFQSCSAVLSNFLRSLFGFQVSNRPECPGGTPM